MTHQGGGKSALEILIFQSRSRSALTLGTFFFSIHLEFLLFSFFGFFVSTSPQPVGSRCGFVSDYLQPVWTVNEETWIKMAVNLSKNGPALMAAYKEVVDSKLGTNW